MDALRQLNFRDIGGIPAAGGRLRHGLIFRSEGPGSFDELHRAELDLLGIQLVCDLRSEAERLHRPNDWAGNARLLNLDINADMRNRNNQGWAMLLKSPNAETARQAMIGNYRVMPASLRPYLAGLVDDLIAGHTPALIHCTAGKDRTGVMIALLLWMVGADEDEIVRDYLLSGQFRQGANAVDVVKAGFRQKLGFEPADDMLDPIVGVEGDYLAAALEGIAELSGSLDAYFMSAGVDDNRRANLAAVLVEPT